MNKARIALWRLHSQHLLGPGLPSPSAELEGVICSGSRRGKQFTYALVEERVPAVPPRKSNEALAVWTQRYFAIRGLATPQDFAWWSGLTVADARLGIAMNEARLASATLDGKRYWFDPSAAIEQADRAVVHLLPNFDERLVAYRDHGPSIDPALSATLDPNRLLFVSHTVVRDGLVAGTWRVSIAKRSATVTARLFVSFNEAELTRLSKPHSRPLPRGAIERCRAPGMITEPEQRQGSAGEVLAWPSTVQAGVTINMWR